MPITMQHLYKGSSSQRDKNSKPQLGLVIGQLSYGGAERQVTQISIELAKHGAYTPIVYCMSSSIIPFAQELTAAGVEWYCVPKHIKSKLSKLYWLIKQVRLNRCDLLYGFLNVGNIYAGATSNILGISLITSIRNVDSSLPTAMKHLSSYFCNHADMVVGNSKSSLLSLRNDLQVMHERTRIIPNIVPQIQTSDNDRHSKRQKWNVSDKDIVIGTVAQLKKQKRPDLFLDTFSQLASYSQNISFVWVGDGPERHSFLTQINQLPHDIRNRVYFEGFQSNTSGYLAGFDIFLLLSDYEGLPNALLEAMSASKACIATEAPGIVDIFEHVDINKPIGLLCEKNNPHQIAETILDLAKQPDKMRLLGQNAQNYVQQYYSSESIIDDYVKLFDQLLS